MESPKYPSEAEVNRGRMTVEQFSNALARYRTGDNVTAVLALDDIREHYERTNTALVKVTKLKDAVRELIAAYDDIAQGHAVAGAWLEAWRFERLREIVNE